MLERLLITAMAGLVTFLALAAVAGQSAVSGPVVLALSATHGVHLDDLVVAAAWLVCIAICGRWWHRAGRD